MYAGVRLTLMFAGIIQVDDSELALTFSLGLLLFKIQSKTLNKF